MEVRTCDKLLDRVMKYSLDMICTIDANGRFEHVSDACKAIIGYEKEELIGAFFLDFVHPEDQKLTIGIEASIRGGQATNNFVNRYLHKSGEVVYMQWSANWSEEEGTLFCVARNITELKKAEQLLRQKDELYNALVEHGNDILGMLDENLNYKYSQEATLKELGYSAEQLVGRNATEFIHPDDVVAILEYLPLIKASEGYFTLPYFRFKNAWNEWRWIETTISNKLADPAVNALVVSSRDVTNRRHSEQKIQESEQRFKALFENHPDIVLIEDPDGVILDVNCAGEAFVKLPKQQIINRPLSSFFPAQASEKCIEYLKEAFEGRNVKFRLEVEDEISGKLILDIIKVPVLVDGKAVAVHSIVRDTTEVFNYHQTIEQQAAKLNTIFESITDAFFTLDVNWHFTYINQEFERLLHVSRHESMGKNIWEVFPEEVGKEFYKQYHTAVATGKAVHFESYFERLAMWLEVKAFPSAEGLSIYFSDVTDKIKNRQELEKLSLVASRTNNSVLIADKDWKIEWVNDGFTRLMGYCLEEVQGKRPSEVLHNHNTDRKPYEALQEKLLGGEQISFEIINETKSGEEVWVNVDITPVFDEHEKLIRFVEVQTDITALKKSELELAKLAKDLYRQNRDLQQFTYIVSHNLRAPVANAIGLLSLLPVFENNKEMFATTLRNMEASVFQLDTVLRDINTILSIRNTNDTIEQERVPLQDVLNQAIHSIKELLEQCGAKITGDIPETASVRGNRAYLHSIFYNLLSNSIKYRDTERPLQIKVTWFGSAERGTIISFADNGTGFDMHAAGDKIFKLYKRFHKTNNGRGIGLFLVKTHIEAMGGKIEVSSQLNVGTRFMIHLN